MHASHIPYDQTTFSDTQQQTTYNTTDPKACSDGDRLPRATSNLILGHNEARVLN